MALYGIALAATLFVMAPVGYDTAQILKQSPLDMSSVQALQGSGLQAIKPLQGFMLRNTDPDVLAR